MPLFILNVVCLVNNKSFCLIQSQNLLCPLYKVIFYLGAQLSVHFTQVSALECPLYRGDFMRIRPENGRCQFFCSLQPGVRFRACPLLTGFTACSNKWVSVIVEFKSCRLRNSTQFRSTFSFSCHLKKAIRITLCYMQVTIVVVPIDKFLKCKKVKLEIVIVNNVFCEICLVFFNTYQNIVQATAYNDHPKSLQRMLVFGQIFPVLFGA